MYTMDSYLEFSEEWEDPRKSLFHGGGMYNYSETAH